MDQYLELRLSHKNRGPTYVYLFTHKAAASFTEIFEGGRENYWGNWILVLFNQLEKFHVDFHFIRLQALVMPKSFNIYSRSPRAYLLVPYQPKKTKKFAKESQNYGSISPTLGK